jgi:hypothetical protein
MQGEEWVRGVEPHAQISGSKANHPQSPWAKYCWVPVRAGTQGRCRQGMHDRDCVDCFGRMGWIWAVLLIARRCPRQKM